MLPPSPASPFQGRYPFKTCLCPLVRDSFQLIQSELKYTPHLQEPFQRMLFGMKKQSLCFGYRRNVLDTQVKHRMVWMRLAEAQPAPEGGQAVLSPGRRGALSHCLGTCGRLSAHSDGQGRGARSPREKPEVPLSQWASR